MFSINIMSPSFFQLDFLWYTYHTLEKTYLHPEISIKARSTLLSRKEKAWEGHLNTWVGTQGSLTHLVRLVKNSKHAVHSSALWFS